MSDSNGTPSKLDLKNFLEYVGEESVRVMICFPRFNESESKLRRSDYQDRDDYDFALFKEKVYYLRSKTSVFDLVSKATELGLERYLFWLITSVAVIGNAHKILALLEYPGIERAYLDFPIQFLPPASSGTNEL